MARTFYAHAIALKPVGSAALDAIEAVGGKKPRKQKLCTLRKLAKVPEDLGKLLDDLNAPWALVEMIAHAPKDKRDELARAALRALLDKRERTGHTDGLAKAICRDHFTPRKTA